MNDEPTTDQRLITTTRTASTGVTGAEGGTLPAAPMQMQPMRPDPDTRLTGERAAQPLAPLQQMPVQQMPVQQMPVQQMPVQQQAPVYAEPMPEAHLRESAVSSSRWRVSPASVMAAAASIVLMLWGAVVLARAGTDAPLDEPAVSVAGFSGTAILGLIVLGGGVLLLIAAFTRSRAAVAFVAIVLGVAAGAIAIEPSWGFETLAAERDGAIAVLVLLVITAAVALLAPDVERVTRRRDEHRS